MLGVSLEQILFAIGYLGIFIIIFAESGFFAGFFLPGDSLLFTAGLLASQGYFNIWWLALGCFICAVAGDSFGYTFGYHVGPKIFTREDSLFFHKKHIERTASFYARHGRKTVMLARVIPVVRTFAPIFAGVGKMPYKIFFAYNISGGFIWSWGFLFIAYFLGSKIPGIARYLEWIVLAIILTSFFPVLWEYSRGKITRLSLGEK